MIPLLKVIRDLTFLFLYFGFFTYKMGRIKMGRKIELSQGCCHVYSELLLLLLFWLESVTVLDIEDRCLAPSK